MIPAALALVVSATSGALITFPAGPRSVGCMGDLNGDGCPDLVLGNVQHDSLGSAFLVSGKDGKLLATAHAPEGAKFFGCSVAPWVDYDGDGVRDFAVSAPGGYFRPTDGARVMGAVYVCSGKSGAVLAKFAGREAGDAFGVEIANVRDIDGDGKDDLLVGAPGMGRAYVLSGKDGKELRVVGSGDTRDDFGEAVCGLGDVDGDGVPDFAVGAPSESIGGRAHLYSGKDGHELRVLGPVGQCERLWFGNGIAAAGDLDGDGRADVLVGSDMDSDVGCARIYSSATGKMLLVIRGEQRMFDHFGAALDRLGDVDGDGVDDYLVADTDDSLEDMPGYAGDQVRGSIVIASGRTGKTLAKVFGMKHFDRLGDSVVACGDLDGDHVPDFVAKAANSPGSDPCWRAFSGKEGKLIWQFDTPVEKPATPARESKR